VKSLLLFHHDPDHSDQFLDEIHTAVQQRVALIGAPITCGLAREGDQRVL
jgi:phosphoribosyl 1,2-cyclic phosphodiesterase